MKLIAKKPCSFGGQQFFIDNEIPVELVKDPETQEKYGVLVIVEGDALTPVPTVAPVVVTDPVLTICVRVGDDNMDLEPTDDGLQDIFSVLIGEPAAAIETINKMTDNDALILIHLADRRATIKNAAKKRAEKLQEPQESAGEQ